MKKTIFMLAFFLGLGVLESQAQTTETKVEEQKPVRQEVSPEQRADRETRRMTKELTLTPDQQTKFKAFSLERINTVAPIQEKMKATTDKAEKERLHKDVKAAREKFDTNVKSILTAEQLPKWEAKKEEKLERKHIQHDKRKVPAND